ncbi:MAG TPA: IS4 family transposase [Longimicrobium sp.]|jgi:hypothetical protein
MKNRVPLEELKRVLPGAQLKRLALKHKTDACNQVRLPGSAVFVSLLDALLNHGVVTTRLLEELYEQRTGRSADHSSFAARLQKIPAEYFREIYSDLHERLAPQASAAEQRALRVRRADATVVALSAKLLSWGLSCGNRKKARAKRQVKAVWSLEEDGLPSILRLCKEQSELSDCVAMGDAILEHARRADLWVFDQGCHDRERLFALHEKGAYWLTPHGQQALLGRRTVWEADPETRPKAEPGKGEPPCWVERVEAAHFGNSQETRAKQAQWAKMPLLVVHLRRWDQRGSKWVPLVLMTNLPLREEGDGAGPFTWAELAEVYRQRWEIEVLFKFLKQHLGYSHLTSRSENGCEVMAYMSLIAALLLIWYKRRSGIDRGWKSVRSWFAHDLRGWVEQALRAALAPPDPIPAP